MIELKTVKFGKTAGRVPIEDMKKIFEFCKKFDVIDGMKDDILRFDVRPNAIHWLNKDNIILSSMYYDRNTGEIKLQKGSVIYMNGEAKKFDGIDWDEKIATKRWNELIKKILE
ncbi:MAG: hypothetical protein QXX38_01305 [Candidatus Aenigmatarchaeota archaeon]